MVATIRQALDDANAIYWYDENMNESIEGSNWWVEIVRNIELAPYFTFLFTNEWQVSDICQREFAIALSLKKEFIPVQIDKFELNTKFRYIPQTYQITNTFELNGRLALKNRYEKSIKNQEGVISNHMIASDPNHGLETYCERVALDNKEIRILGRGDPLNLADIFLQLGLYRHSSNGVNKYQVDDLLTNKVGNKILLTGGPGTGKSTILQFLQYESTSNTCSYFPISAKFRSLARLQQPLVQWIDDHLKGQIGKGLDYFERQNSVVAPKLMVQLDGLDEVPDADADRFSKEILRFTVSYPYVRLIVTSRPTGYRQSDYSDFEHFDILPLSEIDMRGYVEKVVPLNEREKVWNTIMFHPRIYDLATTPFLLALIASAYEDIGPRAMQRATLFRTCIRFLLRSEDYDTSRPQVEAKSIDSLLKILTFIAVRFFKLDYVDNFSQIEVIQNIALLPGYQKDAENCLREIVDRTGLLQFDRDGYQFVHRSIWEYLVAEGCRAESIGLLVDRANSRQWEEPIRLYAGLTPIAEISEVLSAIWERNPTLALRAMTETQEFPDKSLEHLYSKSDYAEKTRIIQELRSTLSRIATDREKERILLDTVSAIVRIETDCEILFQLIGLLRNSGSTESNDMVTKILDYGNVEARLKQYAQNNEFYFDFIYVAPGTYTMGADRLKNGRPVDASEKPPHQVTLDGYWISKFLVVNKLYYDSFPYAKDSRNEYSSGDLQPVNMVTWYETMMFAWWLGCDLPTDAEWEYAARSGGADDESLNDWELLPEYAWYGGNSDNSTHDVGLRKPNLFGLYDVAGNLREWCKDWYSEDYFNECFLNGEVANPTGPSTGEKKVLRGGTFDWALTNLRPTYRNSNTPNNRHHVTGFRIVVRDPSIANILNLRSK